MNGFNPNGGVYSRARIEALERSVTDAEVDEAIKRSARVVWLELRDPDRRADARRNIAIGKACGSYEPVEAA